MSLELQLLQWCQQQKRAGRRVVIGLNGPVGAGKSTLARQLQHQALALDLNLAVASIDDAYLPWEQRLAAMAGNPFGVTRVPPGSHDPAALADPIQRWSTRASDQLELPRFDKTLRAGAGDRISPWAGQADALLLEGWLLGCRPCPPAQLSAALASIDSDAERRWLQRCNNALAAYEPLWDQFDQLLLLWPQRWTFPRRWRFQAEARQRRAGGGWMGAKALQALVDASLKSLPPEIYQQTALTQANWVRVLNSRRRVVWEGSGSAALVALAQGDRASS
jgi:D-glycerate 3-kinase